MKTKKLTTLFTVLAAAFFLLPTVSKADSIADMYRQARTSFSAGDLRTADALLTQIVAAQPSYVPARALHARVKQQLAAKGGGDSMERKCAAVILPKIDFKDVELKLALEALAVAASDATGSEFRPNFILNGGEEVASRKVTIQLRNAPLTTILEYLGKMANVTFRYEQFAVIGSAQLTTEPATVPTPREPRGRPGFPAPTTGPANPFEK